MRPFRVEFSDDFNSITPPKQDFSTLIEASDFASLKNKSFRAVWLSEIGRYQTRQGKMRTDWMYFWWSKGGADDDCLERGTGYAYDYPSDWVSYTPFKAEVK